MDMPQQPAAEKTSTPGSIICFTNARWHTPWWIDRHYLMGGLAQRGWPVIWTAGPLNFWERGSEQWQDAHWFGNFRPEPHHGVMVDFPGKGSSLWSRINGANTLFKLHARRLRQAAAERPRPLIAFVCWPEFLPYLDGLDPDFVVLHINDHWQGTSVWNAERERQYMELADRADLITTLADSMVRDLGPDYAQKIRIVDQAVHAQDYMEGPSLPCPDDLARIPHPRLGYIGRVSQKVDLGLVYEISTRQPDWQWIFVGQVGFGFADMPEMKDLLARCEARPNIHFLGPKDQHLMPAYMGHMDVNTMCYKTEGGYWEAINPLKQLEYLATGNPVVSVTIENVERYGHAIGLANSVDEWITQLDQAINNGGVGSPRDRQEIALANTWSSRVNELDSWLRDMCEGTPATGLQNHLSKETPDESGGNISLPNRAAFQNGPSRG